MGIFLLFLPLFAFPSKVIFESYCNRFFFFLNIFNVYDIISMLFSPIFFYYGFQTYFFIHKYIGLFMCWKERVNEEYDTEFEWFVPSDDNAKKNLSKEKKNIISLFLWWFKISYFYGTWNHIFLLRKNPFHFLAFGL